METESEYDLFYKERQERLPRFPLVYGAYADLYRVRKLFSIIQALPNRAKLLEAGGGSCQYPIWIQHSFKSKELDITCLEPAKWPVDYANKYYRKKSFYNIHAVCSSLENCDFKEKFDFIYAIEVIEHTKSAQKFLQKCSSLLKRGGQIFLTTPNKNNYLKKLKFLKKKYTSFVNKNTQYSGLYSGPPIEEEHQSLQSTKEMKKMLSETGFIDTKFYRQSLLYPSEAIDKKSLLLPVIFLEEVVPVWLPFFSWGQIIVSRKK